MCVSVRAQTATPQTDRMTTSLFGFFDAFDGDGRLGDLAADARLDVGGDLRARLEELLGSLASLTQARLAEVEPGTGLAHDVHRDADVEQSALLGHAFAVHHVEFGDP